MSRAWIMVSVLASVGVVGPAAQQSAPDRPADAHAQQITATITAANVETMPLRIDAPVLTGRDDQPTIQFKLVSHAPAAIQRVQITIAVHDRNGSDRQEVQELAEEQLPIKTDETRLVTLPLATVLQEGDAVMLGISFAATATDLWTTEQIGNAKQGENSGAAPVATPEGADTDAPVDLEGIQVIRSAIGTPSSVRLVVRNRRNVLVTVTRITAFVFDGNNNLRQKSFANTVVAALGVRTVEIRLPNVLAKPDWKVVVLPERAETQDDEHWANDGLEKAKAAVVKQ
jgi:hypothetical protein